MYIVHVRACSKKQFSLHSVLVKESAVLAHNIFRAHNIQYNLLALLSSTTSITGRQSRDQRQSSDADMQHAMKIADSLLGYIL